MSKDKVETGHNVETCPCTGCAITRHARNRKTKPQRGSMKHTKGTRRMQAIIDASDGMPTAEAVKYIEHGREMVGIIRIAQSICQHGELVPSCEECNIGSCEKRDLLTKLEAK